MSQCNDLEHLYVLNTEHHCVLHLLWQHKTQAYSIFCFLYEYHADTYTSLHPQSWVLSSRKGLGSLITQAVRRYEKMALPTLFKNVHTLEKSKPLAISQKIHLTSLIYSGVPHCNMKSLLHERCYGSTGWVVMERLKSSKIRIKPEVNN